MLDYKNFISDLFNTNSSNFESKALSLFKYQYQYNDIYQKFCSNLKKTPENVSRLEEIPFLPIELFKFHEIRTEEWTPEKTFLSSGTSMAYRSKHQIRNLGFYHENAKVIFESKYGKLDQWTIFALLPSYLEQGDSSLISMVDSFIKYSKPESGYFLQNHEELKDRLHNTSGKKLLIGVTYALLDLIESFEINAQDLVIMETGGMKGRRKEMIKEELHSILKKGFNQEAIHSEYGMCELTTQAYGEHTNLSFPKWARVLVRDTNDPLTILPKNKTGGINVIDLANVHSCAFIATQDLGITKKNEIFEVLGRFDNSDIRGCNLLV